MRLIRIYLFLLIALPIAAAHGAEPTDAAERVMAGDQSAVAQLRAAGQPGLDALLAAIEARGQQPQEFAQAVDAVAAQKDAAYSGLYWHTDWETARSTARRTGRPILSLRLLGELTDELSCANSRLFRTLLYPDPAVASLLKEKFVLHWQSLRSVPVMTVDFGDGRTLRRTITGNSLHLVFDAEGRLLDAVPGLYSPRRFAEQLQAALAGAEAGAAGAEASLVAYHRGQLEAPDQQITWTVAEPQEQRPAAQNPDAADAARVTASKRVLEVPTLRLWDPELARRFEAGDDRPWKSATALELMWVVFSDRSRSLILQKNPQPSAEAEAQLIENLRKTVAADTALNEYRFHRRIRRWLIEEPGLSADALVERIYAQLFRTPLDDPWMGLDTPGHFSALPDAGRQVR